MHCQLVLYCFLITFVLYCKWYFSYYILHVSYCILNFNCSIRNTVCSISVRPPVYCILVAYIDIIISAWFTITSVIEKYQTEITWARVSNDESSGKAVRKVRRWVFLEMVFNSRRRSCLMNCHLQNGVHFVPLSLFTFSYSTTCLKPFKQYLCLLNEYIRIIMLSETLANMHGIGTWRDTATK